MSCILHIETSTEACSVAVSEDGLAVFSKEDLKGPSHAVQLGVWTAAVCRWMRWLSAVVPVPIPVCALAFQWRRVFVMDVICHS